MAREIQMRCKKCGPKQKVNEKNYPPDGKGRCPECRGVMSSAHVDYHYSITCHTDDLAVLYCLRGLADFAEGSPLKMIAWAGTGKKKWKPDNCVTFHFSSPDFRDKEFRPYANRLLGGRWCERGASDKDPATPAWGG